MRNNLAKPVEVEVFLGVNRVEFVMVGCNESGGVRYWRGII
jgi:hypothetical protein